MLTETKPIKTHPPATALHLHNGWLIDLEAEAMWSMGSQVEWTITTLVIGLPRQVAVQRCTRADVDLVLRQDGPVWPPLARKV